MYGFFIKLVLDKFAKDTVGLVSKSARVGNELSCSSHKPLKIEQMAAWKLVAVFLVIWKCTASVARGFVLLQL